jgi:hypothetical protein
MPKSNKLENKIENQKGAKTNRKSEKQK